MIIGLLILLYTMNKIKICKALESQVLSNTMSLCLWIIQYINFIAGMCYRVQCVLTKKLPNATVMCLPLYCDKSLATNTENFISVSHILHQYISILYTITIRQLCIHQ